MMSNEQRRGLIYWWNQACKAQGWNPKDESIRHALYKDVLGKAKRFSQFHNDDYTAVRARLKKLAGDLNGALEDGRPEINRKRQLIHVIKNQQIPCLALYVPDPLAYINSIIRDKFAAYKGLATFESLSAFTEDIAANPSQLHQLRMTLARCINDLRGAAGDTIRKMEIMARVLFPVCCPCGWKWDARSVEEAEREFDAHPCPLRKHEEELAEVGQPF